MPFERKGKCVYRKDTGKKKGCSKTEAGAKKYMRALYAHSKDTKEDIDKYATEEEKGMLKENMKALDAKALKLRKKQDKVGVHSDTAAKIQKDINKVEKKIAKKIINKEDVEKYATAEEKKFLKEAGVYDLPVDPDFTRKRLAKKALKKTLGSEPSDIEKRLRKRTGLHGESFLSPFDKSGQPRQYLKILLALEDNPGMTKMEILNDVLGKNLSKEQARGWGTSGLWSPLLMAGLIDSEKDGKVTKYFTGPKWPEYRKNVLGFDEYIADEPPEVTKMAQEMDDAQYPQGFSDLPEKYKNIEF